MKLVDDVVLLSEEQMLRAIELLLAGRTRVGRAGGAASTAALLQSSGGYGENIALVVSGSKYFARSAQAGRRPGA